MPSKLLTGVLVSLAIFILPALGNPGALGRSQLWILSAIGIAAQLLQPSYKPIDRSAPAHDRGTANQIVWSVYLVQLAGVVEATYFRYPESFRWDQLSSVALVIVVLGLAFRTWSVRELGRFFTWHIMVLPDHRVVRSGPYRIVRHPGYCGAIFMYTFTLLFIHAWISAFVAPFVLLAAFWRRIRHEESWLKQYLGKEYEVYCQEVKMLIPFVW